MEDDTKTQFETLLDRLSASYAAGRPEVTDQEYDDLLESYEALYGERKAVGAPVKGQKVRLPTYLGSLRKVKDVTRWSTNYPGPYVIEDKVDGITLLYQQLDGQRRLFTRGDGVEGQDVSRLLPYLRLPILEFDLMVRGEAVIDKKVFEGVDEAAPRNIVSGLFNRREASELLSSVRFIAFEIIDSEETPETQLLQLSAVGFDTVWAVTTQEVSDKLLTDLLLGRKEEAPYNIDGLVVILNRPGRVSTGEDPKDAVAFKGDTPTEIVKVIDVEWTASKDRRLIPVIVYEPVFLSGGTLNRATGSHANFVIDNKIGPGATIRIRRSGDVIPYVEEVLIPSDTPSLPDPELGYFFTGVDFVLEESNQQVDAAVIEHFSRTMKIAGLGPGRIKSLVEAGVETVEELIRLTPERLTDIEGFGPNSSAALVKEIRDRIDDVPLPRLVAASNIFPNIGVSRAEAIFEAVPEILELTPEEAESRLLLVKGFKKLAGEFATRIPEFLDWLSRHPEITYYNPERVFEVDEGWMTMTGQVVVFSGVRNRELEESIKERGGRVTTSVSKNTTIVVTDDPNSTTGKVNRARELGVQLLTIDELVARFM